MDVKHFAMRQRVSSEREIEGVDTSARYQNPSYHIKAVVNTLIPHKMIRRRVKGVERVDNETMASSANGQWKGTLFFTSTSESIGHVF